LSRNPLSNCARYLPVRYTSCDALRNRGL
jgi:hypothetical protein